MKSAGEQSQGQAVWQGFSAQYSQRRISLMSWAWVKNISMLLVGLFQEEKPLAGKRGYPSMKTYGKAVRRQARK
jgi:hypothetical protein